MCNQCVSHCLQGEVLESDIKVLTEASMTEVWLKCCCGSSRSDNIAKLNDYLGNMPTMEEHQALLEQASTLTESYHTSDSQPDKIGVTIGL